jgi:hypothetical protein
VPQQERPQDQLAQAQLLRHQHPYLPDGNPQHPPGRAGHRAQEYALPGQQADLAQELRRAVRGDDRFPRLAAQFDDPDPASQHHNQVITHIPVGEQHIADGNVMLTAIPAQHLKLRRVQDRAASSLGLLRRTRAAHGGGARRRSGSARAFRAARTLPHRVPATSSQQEPQSALASRMRALAPGLLVVFEGHFGLISQSAWSDCSADSLRGQGTFALTLFRMRAPRI